MAVQRDRRRLTVGTLLEDPPTGSTGKAPSTSAADIRELRDRDIFEFLDEEDRARRCLCVTSITDRLKERRPEYSEKDDEVRVKDEGGGVGRIAAEGEANAVKDRLRALGIGWCCKKGKKPEAPNQDSFSLIYVEEAFALYGVYDGHGPHGHDVSDLVRNCLPKLFLEQRREESGNAETAFTKSFEAMQRLVVAATRGRLIDALSSGTTCTMVLHMFAGNGTVTVAHAGDSRSVISEKKGGSWETKELTIDHKPNLPEEKRRIESANPPGRVVFDGYYNHRVFAQKEMIPGLNMSRAIGDIVAHERAGLTAMPDVKHVALSGNPEMLVSLCSDGVWEFIESTDFKDFMDRPGVSLQDRCEDFAKESFTRWMKDSEDEISDDITVVVFEPARRGGP